MYQPVYKKIVIAACISLLIVAGTGFLFAQQFKMLDPLKIQATAREIPLDSFRAQMIESRIKMRSAFVRNLFISGGVLLLVSWFINIFLLFFSDVVKMNTGFKILVRYPLSFGLLFIIHAALLTSPGGEITGLSLMAIFWTNVLVLLIIELLLLQQQQYRASLDNIEIKANNLLARHNQLQQQLHPHFLFNSLNTLNSLIRKHPTKAEEFLNRLSRFLRSSLTKNDQNIILLKDELEICIDYMEMQRIRFENAFKYDIDIPDQIGSKTFVPVFSLQLLIENAFKHNVSSPDAPLTIRISYADGHIVVSNKKRLKNSGEINSGIGLKNLNERYNMISGCDVQISENTDDFTVRIKTLPGL